MSEKIEFLQPAAGPIELLPGRNVAVQVRVKGEAKVLAVRAEAYRERAPAVPKHKLDATGKPGNYAGEIPGFMGEFWIKAYVEFASGAKESAELGPVLGDILRGGPAVNTVDILSPAPGHVGIGENRDFLVRVFAQGPSPSTVESVVAQCCTTGGALLGMPATLEEDLSRPGSGEFTGILSAPSSNPFRIKATGIFDVGTSPVPDNDGDYDA